MPASSCYVPCTAEVPCRHSSSIHISHSLGKSCGAAAVRKVWIWNFKDLLLLDWQALLCPSAPLCVPTSLFVSPGTTFVSLHSPFCPCTSLFVPEHPFVSLHTTLCPWKLLCVPALSFVSLHTLLCPWILFCVPAKPSVSLHISLCPCTSLCALKIGCHIDMQNILL